MRGPNLNLKRNILGRVTAQPGRVWTPVDFLDLGPRAAVDKTLHRLVAAGDLRRVDRGLYDHPAVSSLTGNPAAPATWAVLDAIARRDQARLLVDGMTAANDLGLTTAVPAQVVILTDARLRPIRLGSQRIRFKQAAPSRLYWAGRPAMRVVQALHWLKDLLPSSGKDILERLRHVIVDRDLDGSIAADLRAGLHTLPTWMQGVVRDLLADLKADEGGDSRETPRRRLSRRDHEAV